MASNLSAEEIVQDVKISHNIIQIHVRHEAVDLADTYANAIKAAYTGTQKIIIDFASESFFCVSAHPNNSNDIYFNRLHQLIDSTGIPYDNFEFYNGNLLNNRMYECWRNQYKITNKISTVGFRLHWAYVVKRFHRAVDSNTTNVKPLYFCCFNGAPRRHRELAVKMLWDRRLFGKGIVTLVSSCAQLKRNLCKAGYNSLANMLPLAVDRYSEFTEIRSHNAKLDNSFYNSFSNTYFDFITETLYGESQATSALDVVLKENPWWKEIFFTEKTFRSFYYKRPFLLFGSAHSLQALRDLGFKTFDCLFDESYDTVESWKDRLQHIVQQLDDLCNTTSLEELHQKIQSTEVQSILEHNYNRFFELADRSNIALLPSSMAFTKYEKSL